MPSGVVFTSTFTCATLDGRVVLDGRALLEERTAGLADARADAREEALADG